MILKPTTSNIINTRDGSKTLSWQGMNEHYHSTHGAIAEAKHVYLEAGLKYHKAKELAVFEKEPNAVVINSEDLINDGFGDKSLFSCFIAATGENAGIALIYYPSIYSVFKYKFALGVCVCRLLLLY